MNERKYSFGTIISLWQNFDLSLTWTEDGTVSQVGSMISALCGPLVAVEVPLATTAVQQALCWRYPWLMKLGKLSLPDWMRDKSSHVWEWAWLDKQEQKFGSAYWMSPLPENWRSSVKLTSFRAHAHLPDGTSTTVGFWDLPSGYQSYLCELGYDATP